MRHWTIGLCIAVVLLLNGLSISCTSASEATYYVDTNHPQAADNRTHGSIDRPWKTLDYAFQQLQPGDTLLIRRGTYSNDEIKITEENSGQADRPITIKAYPGEQVTLTDCGQIYFAGAEWWTIEGIVFDDPGRRSFYEYIQIGQYKDLPWCDETNISRHITIRDCEFKHGKGEAIMMWNATDILIEGCYFYDLRSRDAGKDLNAISVPYFGDNITIRNSRFEEIGSDGIQLGSQWWRSGAYVGTVTISGNEMGVNRPYDGILGNVGENAIDIKGVSGPVVIAGNTIQGFRPVIEGQDASGANGDGIIIHDYARNIVIERNLFYDNTTHIMLGKHTQDPQAQDITIRNNVFKEARSQGSIKGRALGVNTVSNIAVYHNTFYDNDFTIKSGDMNGEFYNNVIVGGQLIAYPTSDWEANHNAWVEIAGNVPQTLLGAHDFTISENSVLDSNLHPLSKSPLINAGLQVGVNEDFAGRPRSDGMPDLGAFEGGGFHIFLPFMNSYLEPSHYPPDRR